MSDREFEDAKEIKEQLKRFLSRRLAWVASYERLEYKDKATVRHLIPDLLAALEVAAAGRGVYRVWEVGKGPELVIELASPSNVRREIAVKPGIYEAIGVQELIIFDPMNDDPDRRALAYGVPLMVYQRGPDGQLANVPVAEGRFASQVLGVSFEVEGRRLRLRTPDGRAVPTDSEALAHAEEARCQAEEAQREAEEAQRQAEEAQRQAEDRARQLEAELARLRGRQ